MSKIDVSKAAEIIKKNQVEPATARRIIEEMNIATEGDATPKPPAVKKQYVILVSDPEGRMPAIDLVGWVVQIPETESPATTLERIYNAAYDFNVTKKGRLLPVKSVGEALENVPAKFFKAGDLFVKTKVPVLIVKTNNEIPREPASAQAAA